MLTYSILFSQAAYLGLIYRYRYVVFGDKETLKTYRGDSLSSQDQERIKAATKDLGLRDHV